MKIFRASVVNDLSLGTRLAAKRVMLDIALMRAVDRSRRGAFRRVLRASVRRLREELGRRE